MSKKILSFLLILIIISCVSQSDNKTSEPSNEMFDVNKDYISKNYNSRVRQIILHYTAGTFENSLKTLDGDTKRKVSSHYLINDSITKKHQYSIYNIVPDDDRSWHAGVSEWRRDTDINNSSIGIEIVNIDGNKTPYTKKQIEAVIFLIKKLIGKYDVLPVNIVGHSDIAPQRKIDPGSNFPWKELFDHGISAWYDQDDINYYEKKITQLPSIKTIKTHLHEYGYKINTDSPVTDKEYTNVVKAFQRHFSPNKIDGVMSLENYIILRSLLKKYNSYE